MTSSPVLRKISSIILLIRVHQWIKNGFIFLPAFFAARFLDPAVFVHTLLSFLAFCLMASSIYVLNDYVDIEKDRLHPQKCNRPLASGAVTKTEALVVMSVILLGAIIIALSLNQRVLLFLAAYYGMNLMYSFKLKHYAIIDITIIALGFLLRVAVGGAAAGVPISKWLVLLTFLLAMILALAKRRGEYKLFMNGGQTRKALEGYNLPFIDTSMVFMAAITVVSYIMYTVSPEVVGRIGSDNVYLSTIFVVMGVIRYLQQTIVFDRTESPTSVLYKDRFIQLLLVLWIGFFAFLLYA